MNAGDLIEIIERKICENRIKKVFYSQLMNKDDLVFDIGANIGNRTSVFIKLGAKVIAVEPNPRLAKKLKKKFKKAKVIDKAIGGDESKVILYLNEADVLSSTSKEWIKVAKDSGRFGILGEKFNEQVEVEQTTITSLIKDHGVPKFVKIDTEGTELQIIENLNDNRIDCISFEFHEFHDDYTRNKSMHTINHLNSIGYKKFNISFGESMQFLGLENFVYEDFCKLIESLPVTWGDVYAFNK